MILGTFNFPDEMMIVCTSEAPRYKATFSDGVHGAVSDTTADKGGGNSGFRPHDLLEAALASCINMTVRMYADNRSIALAGVKTKVSLDRSDPVAVTFGYEVEVEGDLSEAEKESLLRAAAACAVRRTLSKQIRFAPNLEVAQVGA